MKKKKKNIANLTTCDENSFSDEMNCCHKWVLTKIYFIVRLQHINS